MKRLVVMIIGLMMVSSALAVLQPQIFTAQNMETDLKNAECTTDGTDFYCFGGGSDGLASNITRKYLVDSGTISEVFEIGKEVTGESVECIYYEEYFYCVGYNYGQLNFKIKSDGTDYQTLNGITDPSNGDNYGCDLRPGYPEIFCYGSANSETIYLRKYNISGDEWDNLGTFSYPDVDYTNGPACVFRNSDELWCHSGTTGSKYVMKYLVEPNTPFYYNTSINMSSHFCRFYDEVMYCYAGNINGSASDLVMYFDTENSETGFTVNPLVESNTAKGACDVLDDNSDLCVGGDGSESKVTRTEYPPIPVERESSAVHQCNINPNCNPADLSETEETDMPSTHEESEGIIAFISNLLSKIRSFIGLEVEK